MNNGWTGGQYSLIRAALAVYLCVHLGQLLPWSAEIFSSAGALPDASASPLISLFPNILTIWDSSLAVQVLVGLGALLCVPLAIGWHDRWVAVAIWYVWACLYGRNPLIANPSLPYIGWLLLAHACLPRAPYGSIERRGQPDPGSSWRMPNGIFAAAWIAMAAGYTYSGYTKLISPSWVDGTAFVHLLNNPLARPSPVTHFAANLPLAMLNIATWGALATELLFAPLALFGRLRPFLWTIMLIMHFSLILIVDFADLSLGMVMLHAFTFDPAWVKSRKLQTGSDVIFYDGECGLCHGVVRWVLSEDRTSAFRFAPLQSEAFEPVRREIAGGLPDSVIVRTASGVVLDKSDAVCHIMERLGGIWLIIGVITVRLPRGLRDGAYGWVAAHRKRIFGVAASVCPMLPPHLRTRFL